MRKETVSNIIRNVAIGSAVKTSVVTDALLFNAPLLVATTIGIGVGAAAFAVAKKIRH